MCHQSHHFYPTLLARLVGPGNRGPRLCVVFWVRRTRSAPALGGGESGSGCACCDPVSRGWVARAVGRDTSVLTAVGRSVLGCWLPVDRRGTRCLKHPGSEFIHNLQGPPPESHLQTLATEVFSFASQCSNLCPSLNGAQGFGHTCASSVCSATLGVSVKNHFCCNARSEPSRSSHSALSS